MSVGGLCENGLRRTADVSAQPIPIDRVAAITHRIAPLVQQVQGDDLRTVDQIRADIVLERSERWSVE